MGINMETSVIVGVKINVDEYFEEYQEIPDWAWCDHRDMFEEDTKFCPECGKGRPKSRTFTRLLKDRLPPEFVKAVESVDRADLDDLYSPRDLCSVIGKLPNGLSFHTNNHEGSPDEVVYYLGECVFSADKWTEAVVTDMDMDRVQEITASVEKRASALGFDGNARISAFNWWM